MKILHHTKKFDKGSLGQSWGWDRNGFYITEWVVFYDGNIFFRRLNESERASQRIRWDGKLFNRGLEHISDKDYGDRKWIEKKYPKEKLEEEFQKVLPKYNRKLKLERLLK